MLSARGRRLLGLAFRTTLSALLIGGLAYHIGSSEILAQMKAARWQAIAGAAVILASNVLIVTPRWSIILSVLGHPIRSAALMRSVFVGFLFNQVLPTGVGGDVVRAWRARQLGVPLETAVHSVLIDRAAGVFVSLLGAGVLLPFARLQAVQTQLALVFGVIAGAAFFGCIALWAIGRLPVVRMPVVGGLQQRIANLRASLGALAQNPTKATGVFWLACVNQCLPVAAIWLLASEMHMPLNPVQIAFVTFVSTLAATLPISIAGWGIREGMLVLLFGLYGIPPDTSFAVSVLYGACLTLSAAPGALLLLVDRQKPLRTDLAA